MKIVSQLVVRANSHYDLFVGRSHAAFHNVFRFFFCSSLPPMQFNSKMLISFFFSLFCFIRRAVLSFCMTSATFASVNVHHFLLLIEWLYDDETIQQRMQIIYGICRFDNIVSFKSHIFSIIFILFFLMFFFSTFSNAHLIWMRMEM